MSTRKTAGIAMLALGCGFVAGAWLLSSDIAIRMLLVNKVPHAVVTNDPQPLRPPAAAEPRVPAVAVPEPAKFSGGSGGLGKEAERFDLVPTLGCEWAIEPHPFTPGRSWHKTDPDLALGGYSSVNASNGDVDFLLVQSSPSQTARLPLRPVFFDAEAKRYLARAGSHSSSKGSGGLFIMELFHLDAKRLIPPEKVAFFGIERVLPDSVRKIAEAARREAKEKGIETLPTADVGKPYPIDLPAADGTRVRTADLGKKTLVVAIYGPGSAPMSLVEFSRIRMFYKPDEVAFVGVSFDGSADDARSDLTKWKIDASLVFVPNDVATRRIWTEALGLGNLPQFLLVDRDGVLRETCGPFNIKDRLDALMGRTKPIPKPIVVKVRPNPGKAVTPPGPANISPPKAPPASSR